MAPCPLDCVRPNIGRCSRREMRCESYAGIVRVPIDRAMEVLVERVLRGERNNVAEAWHGADLAPRKGGVKLLLNGELAATPRLLP